MEVLNVVKVKVQVKVKVVPRYVLMWRPSCLFPILFFFSSQREKYGSHQKFRWYRGVFFGEGVTLGVCCTNGLDFLFFLGSYD